MFKSIRNTLFAGLSALALSFGSSSATAGDYHQPPVCRYKLVTTYECRIVWETRQEAYQKTVVCYDHCGRPYEVVKTCYRDVQVPVKKYVPVTRKVPVCD